MCYLQEGKYYLHHFEGANKHTILPLFLSVN